MARTLGRAEVAERLDALIRRSVGEATNRLRDEIRAAVPGFDLGDEAAALDEPIGMREAGKTAPSAVRAIPAGSGVSFRICCLRGLSGQELVDAVGFAVEDAFGDLDEPVLRVDAVVPGGLDERVDALTSPRAQITETFMKFPMLMALLLLLVTVGCSGSRPDPLPTPIPPPTLTPIAQPFRAQTAFVDNVLSVDVSYPDGRTRTLNSVLHGSGSWGQFLPRPSQPNHSSREWLFTDNHYDGKVLLYAVVSWNDDDPGDYLAAGWWLVYPPDLPIGAFEAATRGVFLDGPELDPARPPALPLTGTATYVGGSGGLYTYTYGRTWGALAGSSEYTEFQGPLTLTADFARSRITGCLGCAGPIETAPGLHLFPAVPWRGADPAALPNDYDIRFAASFDGTGAFEDTAITVTHPERTVTRAAGTWRGQLSNVSDGDGHPRRVVGSTDVHFAEDDGSHGRFTGIFDALTPATVKPDGGNGGDAN